MARVAETREIPLKDLVIGKGQMRTRHVQADLDELAESIRVQGLLEPIIVCPAETSGKFEILTGQRRFLACEKIGLATIRASVLDSRVDEITAKIISLTENLLRRDPDSPDFIDVCTTLYKKYGSVTAVAKETGLPYAKVREFVKYDRLIPELKEIVDKGDVPLRTALRAQDAASTSGKTDPGEALQLAKEMAPMSGPQQDKIVKDRHENPETPVDEIIETAKSGGQITQIIVTLGGRAHQSLQKYAKEQSTNLDDAARLLIEEGLTAKGFSE